MMNNKDLAVYILTLAYTRYNEIMEEFAEFIEDCKTNMKSSNVFEFKTRAIHFKSEFNMILKLIEKAIDNDPKVFLDINEETKKYANEIQSEIYLRMSHINYQVWEFQSALSTIDQSLSLHKIQFAYILKARIIKEIKPEEGVFEKSAKVELKKKEHFDSVMELYKKGIEFSPLSEDGIMAGLELARWSDFNLNFEEHFLSK